MIPEFRRFDKMAFNRILRKNGESMNRKKMICLGMCLLSMALSGCGEGPGKDELMKENEAMLMEIADLEDKIMESESLISALKGDGGPVTAVSEVPDGSGEKTFQSINGRILFPVELVYPGAEQAPNKARVLLSERLSIVPSDNWVLRISGTTTDYSHPDGIYGVMKITAIPDVLKSDELEAQVLKPFTDNIPYTSIKTGSIFFDDERKGMHADMTILNNGQPAVLKSGFIGIGDESMSYCFYYAGDRDNTKNELISNLLKTVKYKDDAMRIE